MIGQFKGKYVDRIKLSFEDKIHLIQISIYPLDEDGNNYMFILDELDNITDKFLRVILEQQ